MGVLDIRILFQGGHYSTLGVIFVCYKTGKENPAGYRGVNELSGCLGRQNPIPRWALLHFWGDTFPLFVVWFGLCVYVFVCSGACCSLVFCLPAYLQRRIAYTLIDLLFLRFVCLSASVFVRLIVCVLACMLVSLYVC